MYQNASNLVEGVDFAFKFIFGFSIFFLLSITGVMIYFVVRYNRKRHPKAVQVKENPLLEIIWTVIPLVLVLIMFYYGYIAFTPMRIAPKDAMVIKTIGKMWAWEFDYGNGKKSKELVMPINKPIQLEMTSLDVIHSLYIPAFRIKEDLMANKLTYMWFVPERLGTYEILCAEYCGLQHSYMEAKARVVEQAEYEKWLTELKIIKEDSESEGYKIIKANACAACHSFDGSKIVGPTFKDLFGSEKIVISDGKELSITADSIYLRESILEPEKMLVKGFNKGLMKSYKGVISDKDIDKIIEYFKEQKK